MSKAFASLAVKDGDRLPLGNVHVDVMHTPGRRVADPDAGLSAPARAALRAFIPSNGTLHRTVSIDAGGNRAGGLWAIEFGVGGNNGSPDVLYFADGIKGEAEGLFGAITAH